MRCEDADRPSSSSVATLLGGSALEVRGLLGVFALVESLDAVRDVAALRECVRDWARAHAKADAVDFAMGGDEDAPAPTGIAPTDVTVSPTPSGTAITVPAHTTRDGWLVFHLRARHHEVGDALQRLLVVAGRICASRLVQFQTLHAIADERESLRAIALGSAHEFLGSSAAAQQVARLLPRLSASDVPVLLTGETGTGKSFVARLIHEGSPRSGEPFRVLNCAATPESSIESELLGHERGAFGAATQRVGALEAAGSGTVFLDEIGELPLASQAKLVRVLEEKRFERIGSNRPIELRARIVGATNRALDQMIAQKTFRDDLYFRISVVHLRVPSLRERAQDIPLLARRILSDLATTSGRRIEGFAPDAMALLQAYSWPGNVRELRNAIEHAIAIGEGHVIRPTELPDALLARQGAGTATAGDREGSPFARLPLDLALLERKAIEEALRVARGNRTRAAALLGIARLSLHNKLRGMKPPLLAAGDDIET